MVDTEQQKIIDASRVTRERGWRFYIPVSLRKDFMKFWQELTVKQSENPDIETDDDLRAYICKHGVIIEWDCVNPQTGKPLDPKRLEDYQAQDVTDWVLCWRTILAKLYNWDVPK